MIRYVRSCQLSAPVSQVFRYSSSLEGFRENFPFEVDWRSGPTSWSHGDELSFRYRAWGFWISHRARVVAFEENRFFVDDMTNGLYKSFRHTHLFETSEHGTTLTDQVDFTLGLGRLVDRTIGWKTLDKTFARRHLALQRHFSKDGRHGS